MPNAGYEYLNNTKADHRLLGISPLLNPFADHVSAQRGKMFSDHAPQSQVLKGSEFAKVFTGYERQVGEYEVSTTERDQDVQVLEVIPKFTVNCGSQPLMYNPTYTVVYLGLQDGKVGYFDITKFTGRSDGFGYTNNLEGASSWLQAQTVIPKSVKLSTSPSHKGEKYCYGTNLRVAYMSLPHVTEDAFLISETARKKCCTEGVDKITISIKKDQIPVNLYGDDENYRFFPDIGEQVNEDGILCALRRPTADSFIFDTAKENLSTVQVMHDNVFYVPKGATIVDIDVVINRTAYKSHPMFAQCEKYRDQLSRYYERIVELFNTTKQTGRSLTNAFNNFVSTAVGQLLVDGKRVQNMDKKKVKPRIRKEVIDYISLTITYKYDKKLENGFKLAGRYGNKGVVSLVVPDEMMPVDEQGLRADIVVDPVSVFNRMNPAQWYEQYLTRGSELIVQRARDIVATTNNYEEAYNLIISYCMDVNENYGKLIVEKTPTPQDKVAFVNACFNEGLNLNVVPFQKGIDQHKIMELIQKYHVYKSKVTFGVSDDNGNVKWVTTKKPVMIGYEYWMLLYKTPHMHGSGISYVNQYRTPVKGSKLSMAQYPTNQTPFRLGEDEIRNLTMLAGAETAAKILCEYANNPEAVSVLANHLLNDEKPGKLKAVTELTIDEMIQGNNIVGVTKHMFSSFGVDMSPADEE